jgi:hypothetical protein
MSEITGVIALTPSQAVAAYNRIGKRGDQAWQEWLRLGRWIDERRAVAIAKAGGTTRGPTYARHLQRQLGQFHPIFQKLSDGGHLSGLSKCLANLAAVEAWRARVPIEERQSSPRRVWEAFDQSLHSTPEFVDEDPDADDDEDEDSDDDKPARGGHRAFGHNREKELLAEVGKLQHLLEEHEMSIYPEINAQRIHRRMVEVVGHEHVLEVLQATLVELQKIVARLAEDREFDASNAV